MIATATAIYEKGTLRLLTPVSPVSYTHLDVYKRQEIIATLLLLGAQVISEYEQLSEPQPLN